MTEQQAQDGRQPKRDNGGFTMMAMMMVCCMAVVLLIFLIPVVGWPIGLSVGAAGFIAMLFVHQRMMRHGGHHGA